MHRSRLEDLPPELLSHLLSFLPLDSLLALSATSRLYYDFITRVHLPDYAVRIMGARSAYTLQHLGFHRFAPWPQRAMWAERTAQRWDVWDGRGAVVSQWGVGGKCLPVLKLWEVDRGVGTVLVGKGRELEMWMTRSDGSVEVVPVLVASRDRALRVPRAAHERGALDDVTSLASGTRPGEIVVARHSGLIQRLTVVQHADVARRTPLVLQETARYGVPSGSGKGARRSTAVQALHSEGGLLAAAMTTRSPPPSGPSSHAISDSAPTTAIHVLASSLSSRAATKTHSVTLHSLSSPWQPPVVLPFAAKPWSVHLSTSRRWLAVGHTGTSPLSLYTLDSTGCPTDRSATMLAHTPRSTSVYGLTSPDPMSAFANPDQTLLAAFYDSTARVYDLRIPPAPLSNGDAAADDPSFRGRNEVIRLADPWSDDAAYSIALGGVQGAILAVGSARNAAVRLFDLRSSPRSPLSSSSSSSSSFASSMRDCSSLSSHGDASLISTRTVRTDRGGISSPAAPSGTRPEGLTAFAPGRDRSPVYGLAGEPSRFWGVTDQRGFVLDFDAFGGSPPGRSSLDLAGRRGGGGAGGGGGWEAVAYVGHEEGGGGKLRWMGGE